MEKLKKYEAAEMEIVEFQTEDILTASGNLGFEESGNGDEIDF